MRISVIHEEPDFIVIDKPAGISVHGGGSVKGPTITEWLMEHYPEVRSVGDDPDTRPGIVHRLDKDTSGVMVVARTQASFNALKQLFKSREVKKTYLALVFGTPKKTSGVIDVPLGRLEGNPTKRGAGKHIRGERHAVTEYKVLERLGKFTLVEARPKTGRMHQIRVHFASLDCPVAGDTLYGRARTAIPGLSRQFLHAWRIEFSYPAGRRLRFEASLPEDLQNILNSFRQLRANTKPAITIEHGPR